MKRNITLRCYWSLCFSLLILFISYGQNIQNNPKSNHGNKFEQLGIILPDANSFRNAAGAPGSRYWQMKADYSIDAFLDEENLVMKGEEWIVYHNQSPDPLDYVWLQLDENENRPEAESNYIDGGKFSPPFTEQSLKSLRSADQLVGHGVHIFQVKDQSGNPMVYEINQTMMRVNLNKTLLPGKKLKFFVSWSYKIPDRMKLGGRGGLEYFEEDGNHLFTIAQWYPRMCVYSDFQGWQNKQFTGRAEFALAFGDFDVRINVPSDHIVAATGECQNYRKILNANQFARWKRAETSTEPVEIVLLDEARNAEKNKSLERKIWHYKAKNVRDFAFGSSRKFIWDAMKIDVAGKPIMCMSYYPKEAYGLYRKFSTKVVAHTIRTYSKYTVDYPYPVAISVEASNGMEYPMICFNGGRTEKDGTYSEGTKYGMLGVVIHEVGHNFFPMIINSDERQWTWMDEGLNTFVQYLTQEEFDNNYPSARGPAHKIVDYMSLPKEQLEPVMTNSENLIHFGSNAYHKTATALNILRETIMGRTLFDYAFKQYAQRWKLKHPTPADFFRTMEDASGVDLDWFWRAWFFGIDPVDISIDSVKVYAFTNKELVSDSSLNKSTSVMDSRTQSEFFSIPKNFVPITKIRNKASGTNFLVDMDTTLRDFYYYYNVPAKEEFTGVRQPRQVKNRGELLSDSLFSMYQDQFVYEIYFSNIGGTVMPIILQWNYEDGTSEVERIHAYIWRKNEDQVVKSFLKNKKVKSIELDPYLETADINLSNNYWLKSAEPSRFEIFKSGRTGNRRGSGGGAPNPMQKAKSNK